MRFSLRHKLFLTIGAGAAVLACAMSILVHGTVMQEVEKTESEALREAVATFDAFQSYRRARLLERCRLVSDLPYFKAAAAVYDPTRPALEQPEALATVEEVATRVINRLQVDLLVLTTPYGEPVIATATGGPIAITRDFSRLASRALSRGSAEGILDIGTDIIYLTVVPLSAGGMELGTLALGTRLGSHVHALEEMTGGAVALVATDRVIAKSQAVPAGADSVLLATRFGASHEASHLVAIGGSQFRAVQMPLWETEIAGDSEAEAAFVVLRSREHALAMLTKIRSGLVGTALAAVAVALLLSYLFSRQITGPVRTLVAFTERVGRGDLTAQAQIGTGDELAVLGGAFNRMTRGLEESREHLETSNRILEERSAELEEANRMLRHSRDATESANQALREAHAQLIQAGKMAAFGELGAGLAHELRQPLSSIRGFAQLVRIKTPDSAAECHKYTDLIVESVDHMTGIVQGLKDFARTSGQEFQPVDLNRVIERTSHLLETQLRNHNVRLERDLAENPPSIPGEPNQLQQVFTNLIANARDAMTDGGTVRIRSRLLAEGSYLLVSVEDTGPGIPAENLPRIFGSFFTTKPEEGTGLGLAISQGIVNDHGGRIDVVSEPGAGATFRVLLPTETARNCWEMIDCVSDCRPEISGKEECVVYRERHGHRCWHNLARLAEQDPSVTRPQCDACPVYIAKTTFVESPAPGDDGRKAA